MPSALVVIVLGYLGFDSRGGAHSHSFWDQLYESIQLFWLQSGDVHPVPLTLQIARFGAPIITGYAAGKAIASILRDQFLLLHARFFFGTHVVIAGLGAKGFKFATALHDAGSRVVIIDKDRTNRFVPGCRERGIPVVVGDATDPAVLRSTRLVHARQVVITCGEDDATLDVLVAASELTNGKSRPLISAHLTDLRLWRTLRTESLGSVNFPRARLDFFNLAELAAREILESYPPRLITKRGATSFSRVLIVGGIDSMTANLVVHAARKCLQAKAVGLDKLEISLVGPAAEAASESLLRRYPALRTVCQLHAHPIDQLSLDHELADLLHDPSEASDLGAAYVCITPETDALAAALAIHSRKTSCPIVVVVQDEEAGVGSLLRSATTPFRGIEVFGILTRTAGLDVIEYGAVETIARAMHDEYARHERARGLGPADNPALVEWTQLPEQLKESNRRFAEDVNKKLQRANCVLVPEPLAAAERVDFSFSGAEVEELARLEHERWIIDLQRLGWRRTSGAKNPDRKLHPLLVDWAELSEDEREKDRLAVRMIPGFLARAGFSICRSEADSKDELSE